MAQHTDTHDKQGGYVNKSLVFVKINYGKEKSLNLQSQNEGKIHTKNRSDQIKRYVLRRSINSTAKLNLLYERTYYKG